MNWLKILDIAIILSVIFNCLALAITNAIVVKANPQQQITEANPVKANLSGWQQSKDANKIMLGFFLHVIGLSIIIYTYILERRKAAEEQHFRRLLFLTIMVFLFCTLDFMNDLGFYIGKVVLG